MLRISLLLMLSFVFMHCAKRQHSSNYIQPAPAQKEDLGFIVTAEPEEIDQLKKANPDLRIRALSLQRNLFEISGSSENQLRQYLKSQKITANTFIQQVSANADVHFLQRPIRKASKDISPVIRTCRKTKQVPQIQVQVSFDTKTKTILLGESVDLRAQGIANEKVGGDVQLMWDMVPPMFSQQSFSNGFLSQQTFTPDSTGLYRVAAIAQGKDLSCSMQEIYFMVTSNPEFSDQLSLPAKIDLSIFKHIAEVKADLAWSQSQGENITIAVLDSGVNYNHPGIRDNLKFNENDMPDGKDQDGNGLKDDYLGWDFINADGFPFDDDGHGTHVSGLVASPLSGIAPKAKILPLKILSASGQTDTATFVAGIYYAIDSGAQIINASIEMSTPNVSAFTSVEIPQALLEAIEVAQSKNILFVSAAGNGDKLSGLGFDITYRPVYPASFDLPNTLAVAATSLGLLTEYSNYSAKHVHVAAPGGDQNQLILSLAKENPMGFAFAPQAGTSMATPIVSGLAALMLSANPQLLPNDIKNILIATGDPLPTLPKKTVNGKLINAEQAVKAALDFKPVSP
ncbi:S8 family serine peptidase [bacterium]|nr:S8 family serine peptidase [bacterium]